MSAEPGKMYTKSMLGNQVSSKKHSAPAYGFGSSSRQQANKVFVSAEHARLASHGAPPGPSAYSLKSAVSSQPDSRKTSAPNWAFGTAERFTYEKKSTANPGPGAYQSQGAFGGQLNSSQATSPVFGFGSSERKHVQNCFVSEEHNKARHGHESPGPMVYKLKGAFNKQDASKNKTAAQWVFGSQERFQYDHVKRAATSPGPGAYSNAAAVGAQVSSTRPSSQMYGFGSSNRDHMEKVYVSPEHEKMNAGVHSPGPAVYTRQEATGKQHLSQNSSLPSWGFGSAERWSKKVDGGNSPGPGAYCI